MNNFQAFLLVFQLSLIWGVPVPQGFSHSSDVHHVSVTFGSPQVSQLKVPTKLLVYISCSVLINWIYKYHTITLQKPGQNRDTNPILPPPTPLSDACLVR